MIKRMIESVCVCSMTALMLACDADNRLTKPVNLRTEYLVEPIGLDCRSPRFTWEYGGDENDFKASRYEVKIGLRPDKMEPYHDKMPLQPHTRYYWNVKVWDGEGRECAVSETASFETAKFSSTDWSASWISDKKDKEYEPSPMFRSSFNLDGEIARARLYVASAGYHEFFINGERVGESYLDPGYTHFDKRILYVTHDVTPLLREGDNAIAAVLGNGWYNEQSVAVWNFHEASWRGRPSVMCELRVTYKDGTIKVIGSDKSWKTSTGAYLYNNIYSGDRFDARLVEDGWKMAEFDDSKWNNASEVHAPTKLLAAQQMPGIRITEELAPTSMKRFSDKLYVYSFPKNIAGSCRISVKGEAGTRITLKHGELLKSDGRLQQGNIDVYYHPVKRGEVFQMDEFILNGTGEEEIFMPSFTYHGFQHVEVECSKPVELTEKSLTALFMHTDLDPVGKFECSNQMLNKIWDATMQAYRSNIHSIPTDCPQREKNGWTADAHVSIDLGLLGFDGITFYEKWVDDIIDNQRESGEISGIIPSSGWGYGEWPGPVWDAAMFIVPNALYEYYGDDNSIKRLYPTMRRYLSYLAGKEKDGGFISFGIGDWVYWKATTNTEYTSTAYYYLDNILMARFASIVGEDSKPYMDKAAKLKELINGKYFNEDDYTYAEGTQAALAVALYLDLVPEGKQAQVAAKLREIVAANNHFLDFGLLGSKTVPAMLTKYGYIDDAMKMVMKREAPSWGYWVETMGYTTLPETWTLSPKFADASLNHVFMGDVSAWMMNCLAGINRDPANPGFNNIIITPHFVKELDWVKGEYRSVKGLITSEWRRVDGLVELTVRIPSGCTADIVLADRVESVGSGLHKFKI